MKLDPDAIGALLRRTLPWSGPNDLECLTTITEDDCAAIDLGGVIAILTSDFVNANPISVTLGIASPQDLGHYLVAANVADLCGTLATPVGLLLNIVWPVDRDDYDFELLLNGVHDSCARMGVGVLGGDTKLGPRLVLNAAALGVARETEQLAIQSRAEPGDDVWVSGRLGSCAAAAYILGNSERQHPLSEWAAARILRPVPPIEQSRRAAALRLSAAGCDISDGLGADLNGICDASDVGVRVTLSALPVEPELWSVAAAAGVHPGAFAFTVGGDMQTILVARTRDRERIADLGYTRIGCITTGGRTLVGSDGVEREFPAAGHRDVRGLSFPEEISYLLRSQDIR